MEERIRLTATDLFVRDGYNGVSFLTIGKILGITHSNIHYYYKTKTALADAALSSYAAETLSAYEAIWANPETSFFDKVVETRDWAYARYLRYNPGGSGASHWGLLERFGADSASLGPGMRRTLRETTRRLEELIRGGIAMAVRRGELRPETPIDDLVLQIATVLYANRQVTRQAASFDRLDDLLRAMFQTFVSAFGTKPSPSVWPSLPKRAF